MRSVLVVVTAAVALANVSTEPARAQLAVMDVNSILKATQQLTTMQAEIKSLSSVALSNPVANLGSINAQATAILQSAGGIGFTGSSTAAQFQTLYPQVQSGNFQGLLTQYQQWQKENQKSLQTAYSVQSQVAQSQAATQSAVNGALGNSAGASGQVQVQQSTNQLLAMVSTQLAQLQTILLTQARAESSTLAQQAAIETAADAEHQRAIHGVAPTAPGVTNGGQL